MLNGNESQPAGLDVAGRALRLGRRAHLLGDFLAVIDEGGIRHAAARIHLSQSALTRRIQDLEDALGVSLFERTVRGMALTRFGEILMRHARAMHISGTDTAREIEELRHGARGRFEIGAGTAWSYALVPDAIAALRMELPDIHVVLDTRMADAVERLASGQMDVVVGAQPLIHSDLLCYEPLLDVELGVFARQAHPLAVNRHPAPLDLAGFPWVWLGETDAMRPPLADYCARHGLPPPEFAFSTTSVQVGMRVARGSDHLILLPSTLRAYAGDYDLVQLRLDQPLARYSAGIACRPGTANLRVFDRFKAQLQAAVSGLPRG